MSAPVQTTRVGAQPLEQGLARIKKSPGGTPYANARIRAARGRLLSAADTLAYLHVRDFAEFCARFAQSTYKDHYESALLTKSGIDAVSLALQTTLSDTYYWVVELSEDKYRRFIIALAAKWDIQDLKTIIRAKAAGAAPTQADNAFVGVGVQIDRDSLRALAQQKSLEDVVALVLTWRLPYWRAFTEGLQAYFLRENIAEFELLLDHEYTKWARKQLHGLGEGAQFARSVFGQKVDQLNIATLVRLVDATDEVEDAYQYFLSGGAFLKIRDFLRLAGLKDLYELTLQMGIPHYAKALQTGYDQYQLTGHYSEIERALEVQLTRETIAQGYKDILGFGVALSYLTAIENEIMNLNIIAHGLYRTIAPSLIERDLTLV